ncbi:MAG: S41 family peptidase, partial [Polaribacter sp.]
MKNFIKTSFLLVFSLFLLHCSKEYKVPDNLVVHNFVWKGLNAYYLYQDKIEDLSDRRFNSDQQLNNYLRSFSDYNNLFTNLLQKTDTISTVVKDY